MPYKDKKKQYAAIARSWSRRKKKVIELLGGKCQLCGYCKNATVLQLHHRNPLEKKFDWGVLRRQSWKTIHTEIAKCDLLCANCHTELTYPDPIHLLSN